MAHIGLVAVIPIFLSAVAGITATTALAQSKEKCYGVARAGQNDGLDDPRQGGASSATVDYQGNAWVLVDANTCSRIVVPPMSDGTERRGALEPLDRDRPAR